MPRPAALPVLVCALLLPSLALAHEPIGNSGGCACEDEQYTLTVNPPFGGAGTLTVSPEKECYRKGEWVTVSYEEGEMEVFKEWTSDPPSQMVSGCFLPTTTFYITGDMTVNMSLRLQGEVVFSWDPNFGDVELPEGAELVSQTEQQKMYRIVGKPFTPVTLTGTANEGYHVVWEHYTNRMFEDSITVLIGQGTQTLGCRFWTPSQWPDHFETFTVSVSGAGEGAAGGIIRMADTTLGAYNPPPYLASSVRVQTQASMRCTLEPDHAFVRWSWEGGEHTYNPPVVEECELTKDINQPVRVFTAEVVEKAYLVIVLDGGGIVTGSNLRFGYNPVLNTPVNLHAEPCVGYTFDHWEKDNGEGEWETVGTPGWPYYNLTMDDSKLVKAVFTMTCPCGPRECPQECAGGVALAAGELLNLHKGFPKIQDCNVKKTDEATDEYDCFGWALGDMENHTYEDFDADRNQLLEAHEVIAYFSEHGQCAYILYGDPEELDYDEGTDIYSEVRHAAVADAPCSDQCAESKLGDWIRIVHDAVEMTLTDVPEIYAAYGRILFEGSP